jgi:hypothetical protein
MEGSIHRLIKIIKLNNQLFNREIVSKINTYNGAESPY